MGLHENTVNLGSVVVQNQIHLYDCLMNFPPFCSFDSTGFPADVFSKLFVHRLTHYAIIIRLLNDKGMYFKRVKGG